MTIYYDKKKIRPIKSTFLKLIVDYVVRKKKVFTAEDCKDPLELNHTAN